jgi:hypothetical protein
MCTANPPPSGRSNSRSAVISKERQHQLQQLGGLISPSSKSSISVEAVEAELIRLEAPDAEAVGLRDAFQRLVLEGRLGAGQTLAN